MDNINNINAKLVTSDVLTKKFITETDFTKYFITELEKYLDTEYDIKSEEPILLLDYILGEKLDKNYNVENNFIFSIPKYDISIISYVDSETSKDAAYNFYYDVIDDIAYYIKLYEYEELLGKPREKKYKINHFIIYKNLTNNDFEDNKDAIKIPHNCNSIIKNIFDELEKVNNLNDYETKRRIKAIRSILTESINDAKEVNNLSESRLDIVKNFIKNYDKDQLNFIHYDNKYQQTTKIQGIAGSGKTFLLLHKLIREYIRNKDSKIIMTCHNKSLVVDLRSNINSLANSLKIKEQIDWENRLTLSHAWDIYRKICYKLSINYYPFFSSLKNNSFDISCSKTLKDIENIKIEPIYDFIFIDEAQDLPESWIKLCEKISKKVYVAFDIFQNIFNIPSLEKVAECDYTLSHCYRTPPFLLMFGHSIAMGLFENDKKIQWFDKPQYWEKCGYIVDGNPELDSSVLSLSRHPLSRFENEEKEECLHFYDFSNINIYDNKSLANKIIEIIDNIKVDNSLEDRLHEIIIIDNREDYESVIALSYILKHDKGLEINNIIESKERSFDNSIQFTNVNNVKGLEFGFVIITDITLKQSIISRNRIYMSLTRALLEAHIIFFNQDDYSFLWDNYKLLQSEHCIKTKVPTLEERNNISKAFNTSKKYTPDKNIVFEILKATDFKGDINKFIAMLFDSIESNDNKKIESEEDLKSRTYELLKFYN